MSQNMFSFTGALIIVQLILNKEHFLDFLESVFKTSG